MPHNSNTNKNGNNCKKKNDKNNNNIDITNKVKCNNNFNNKFDHPCFNAKSNFDNANISNDSDDINNVPDKNKIASDTDSKINNCSNNTGDNNIDLKRAKMMFTLADSMLRIGNGLGL